MTPNRKSAFSYLDNTGKSSWEEMHNAFNWILMCGLSVAFSAFGAAAQDQATQGEQAVPPSAVVTKSVKAVGYQVGGGSTKVDLKGTELRS